MLSLPLKTQHLEDLLPHRPPMVWVSEVLSFSDTGGTCRAIWPNSQVFNSDPEFQQTVMIEWMAQSFAFLTAYKIASADSTHKTFSKAFLVGLNDLQLRPMSDQALTVDAVVRVELKHMVPPFSIFSAYVTIQNIEYGRGTMKVFGE